MSDHTCTVKYKTPKGKVVDVEVMLGWDKPLQRPFMVIEEAMDPMSEEELNDLLNTDTSEDDPAVDDELGEDEDENEGLIYSNLDDDYPNKNLAYFKEKLEEFGIVVPESMFIETQKDIDNNEGNRELSHSFSLES